METVRTVQVRQLPPIAAMILRARRERGWSRAQLAASVDKSIGWVSHVENGRRVPRTLDLMRIAQVLRIDLDTLASTLRRAGREGGVR